MVEHAAALAGCLAAGRPKGVEPRCSRLEFVWRFAGDSRLRYWAALEPVRRHRASHANRKSLGSIAAPFKNVITSCEVPPLKLTCQWVVSTLAKVAPEP